MVTQTGANNSRVGKVLSLPFAEPQKVARILIKKHILLSVMIMHLMHQMMIMFIGGKVVTILVMIHFCDGIMYLNKDGFISDEAAPGYYENYFYKGVMIDGKKMYDDLMYQIDKILLKE